MSTRAGSLAAFVVAAAAATGCVRAPTPLEPRLAGSIGIPHRGALSGAAALAQAGPGYERLRQDDRNFAIPRFVAALERAAATVAGARPGGVLSIGDLSKRDGGQLLPHISHRTGRDADLLLYVSTLDGAPVTSPGFVHVEADGLAWDDKGKRFLRFDVERQWLLVKALLEDPEARVQWLFASRNVRATLLEWAEARGEPAELRLKAMEVMAQPKPGGVHDDHLHVRTACAPEEVLQGCEPTGPRRAWLEPTSPPAALAGLEPSDDALALELLTPLAPEELAERTHASRAP